MALNVGRSSSQRKFSFSTETPALGAQAGIISAASRSTTRMGPKSLYGRILLRNYVSGQSDQASNSIASSWCPTDKHFYLKMAGTSSEVPEMGVRQESDNVGVDCRMPGVAFPLPDTANHCQTRKMSRSQSSRGHSSGVLSSALTLALAFKLACACAFAFPLTLPHPFPVSRLLNQAGQHRNNFKQDLFPWTQIPVRNGIQTPQNVEDRCTLRRRTSGDSVEAGLLSGSEFAGTFGDIQTD